MARIAIYNCKACKLGRRVAYDQKDTRGWFRVDDQGRRVAPGKNWDRQNQRCGDAVCSGCGRFMDWNFLDAVTVDTVRCDARCTNARGHKCDCSCGGENHGAGWSIGGAGLFTGLMAA